MSAAEPSFATLVACGQKSRALKKKSTRSQKTFSPTEPPIPDAALCTGNQTSFSISYTREATMSVGERRLRLLRRQISRAECRCRSLTQAIGRLCARLRAAGANVDDK
jgi:hypothetical protein